MIVITFAVVVGAIEILLLLGKVFVLRRVQENLENSLASLVPSNVPWWINAFDNLWRSFHFPAFLILAPLVIFSVKFQGRHQLVVRNEYLHGLNFVTLVGVFWWTSSIV